MKKVFIAAAAGLALASACNAAAQEVRYLGANARVAVEAAAQPALVPEGVTLVSLERWKFKDDTFSARPITTVGQSHPGSRQGVLGFISFTPFAGGRTLYACITNDYRDRFTSGDPNCEGQIPYPSSLPITGYIASTQLPGTVPLYRCMRGGLKPGNWADHFETLDVNCENVRFPANDGIIGYIWL
ncbi:hypothetical protein [Xanthomonas euvesicatoria]|uniref:hypothetical protein n=1 Tax=Xanthomonas euvesicatoria TaxID=456327 RepID=UPI001C436859|nr:hypothetical protein [Xanthomonas euvesicatoria]MBV6850692.1 hypothetical protein [Xanthomonas campestris pv. heliotropii]